MAKKVYLALSGGVDSSVAAVLLLKKGYDVFPVFLKCWSEESAGLKGIADCPWKEDQESAIAVCKKLGIQEQFQTWNFEPEFFESVVEYFISEHKTGRTPNPDVICNQTIKFGLFFERALKEGADFVATGHYAKIKSGKKGYQLLKAECESKNDQTYFLYRITQEQLSRTLFPIGEFKSKDKVRALAKKRGLPSAEKKSTRGICFVGKKNQKELLFSFITPRAGSIVTKEGELVGRHQGVEFYTLGQRRGIGLFGGKSPLFVAEKDLEKNVLVVAPERELWEKEVLVSDLHWISSVSPKLPFKCSAFIRHPQPETTPCILKKEENNTFKVIFKKPQWAPTKGQSVVFYQKEVVAGGAVIT